MMQLGFDPSFDTTLHKPENYGIPAACGVIYIYSFEPTEFVFQDLGLCSPAIFTKILYSIIYKNMDYYLNEAFINPAISDTGIQHDVVSLETKFRNYCSRKNYYPVGVIPYKLFQFQQNKIEKIDNFAKDLYPKIQYALEKIQALRDNVKK
jgi:hypothetical protein